MITQTDAINIGKQITEAMHKELVRETESKGRCTVRGTVMSSLDNLWHEVFPEKVRASFNYKKELYYASIGW